MYRKDKFKHSLAHTKTNSFTEKISFLEIVYEGGGGGGEASSDEEDEEEEDAGAQAVEAVAIEQPVQVQGVSCPLKSEFSATFNLSNFN